jgi:hypothetical protein
MHLMLRDAYASMAVDQALKALIVGCREAEVPVPGIVMVVLDDTSVQLHLSAPSMTPPSPWQAGQGGLTWQSTVDRLQRSLIERNTRNSFRRLVTFGLGANGRVFVDLAQAHGLISIAGPAASRLAIARRLIEDLSSSPWANDRVPLRIALVGLEPLASARTDSVASLGELVGQQDAGGVVLVERLPPDSGELLLELETSGAWTVIVMEAIEASWQFTADADGNVTSHFLPAVTTTEFAPAALESAETERV